jgi:DNA modification methylase
MRQLGYISPIVVDKSGMIVAGHLRFDALLMLGVAEVWVVRLDHLTEAQVKAFMIADNKLAEMSEFDDRKLALLLQELCLVNLDVVADSTGFEIAEIELRIQSLDPPEEDDADDDVEVPEGKPVCQLGDTWDLGRNRIHCGNAQEAASFHILLGDKKAAASFTDHPYNVVVNGHVGGKGRRKHPEFPMASGEMSDKAYRNFLLTTIRHIVAYSTEEATLFACIDWRHVEEMIGAIRANDCELVNLCVWVKPNAGMGSLYRSRHELVPVFSRKGVQRRNNVQLGKFGRTRTNIWNYHGMNSFARRGQIRGLDLHPTVKPLAMVSDAILDVTVRDDIVLDPFCGSGTTIIAAERTGRRGFGIELNPLYVDTTIIRWQRMTNQAAIHVGSGKTFDEMRREREGADVTS